MRFWVRGFVVLAFLGVAGPVTAQDGPEGFFSVEVGFLQAPGDFLRPFSFSSLRLKDQGDVASNITFGLSGEADWQAASNFASVPWSSFPVESLIPTEVKNSPEDGNLYSLRLDQAFLKWVSGPWETSLGLQNFDWGSAFFYRPTDYFFPLEPLQWDRDQPLSSEALDVSRFVLDDFSLEGAVRWLQDGRAEEVLRFVNKGIGLTFTPSFAHLEEKDGLGLEVMGTFPDFQVRWEGVDWVYPGGKERLEWISGVSTVKWGMTYTLEVLRDFEGEAMGIASDENPDVFYLSGELEGKLAADLKMKSTLVKSPQGGPFLFWPRVEWNLAPDWLASFEGQVLLGNGPGPLSPLPARTGVEFSYVFH